MKNIGVFFYLKSLGFLEVKISIYLNRRVFVMNSLLAVLIKYLMIDILHNILEFKNHKLFPS